MPTPFFTPRRASGWPTWLAGGLLAVASHADDFTLAGGRVAGGGGTSAGGAFQLTGTIAQPDAGGPLTNTPFSLTGGVWALPFVIQSDGAPTLSVTNATPGFATISWNPATPGFVLQSTPSLSPAAWSTVDGATAPPVTVPALAPRRYYRLVRP